MKKLKGRRTGGITQEELSDEIEEDLRALGMRRWKKELTMEKNGMKLCSGL